MTSFPNSDVARDIAHVLHPVSDHAVHARDGAKIIVRGEGIHVFDETGKDYIEGMSGLWCTSLGFGEERLFAAADEAMRTLPFYHGFTGKAVLPTIDVAERLKAMMPFEASKVFFSLSGSDANDTQLKLIWAHNNVLGRPNKKKIIARRGAYHGSTIGAASMTHLPAFRNGFEQPLASYILHTDCPHYYRDSHAGESEEEFSDRLAKSLEDLILAEDPETIAAFIAEPVMGAGGVLTPPAGYFERVQAILKRHDILFIADEVICGFGRTGNMFGCETYGITPDTMTVAKQLSSGYLPIAASIYPEAIYQSLVTASEERGVFGHGYTYGGHPVPAAVAKRTLEIYEEDNILGHVRQVTPRFQDHIRRLSDHPLVGDARGVGLLGAFELVADKRTRQPFDPASGVGAFCAARSEAHGLIGRASGNVFMLCPPLIIKADEIDELFRRVESALNDTWKWVRENNFHSS